VVYQAIDGGQRHSRIGEDLIPGRERLVGGDGDALALVSFGDQLEQHAGFRLIAPYIAHVVEDQ